MSIKISKRMAVTFSIVIVSLIFFYFLGTFQDYIYDRTNYMETHSASLEVIQDVDEKDGINVYDFKINNKTLGRNIEFYNIVKKNDGTFDEVEHTIYKGESFLFKRNGVYENIKRITDKSFSIKNLIKDKSDSIKVIVWADLENPKKPRGHIVIDNNTYGVMSVNINSAYGFLDDEAVFHTISYYYLHI